MVAFGFRNTDHNNAGIIRSFPRACIAESETCSYRRFFVLTPNSATLPLVWMDQELMAHSKHGK